MCAPIRSTPVTVFVVIFVVGMAVALIAIAIGALQRGRRLLPRWQAAAEELGISPPPPMGGAPKLAISGTVGAWGLSIAEKMRDDETVLVYDLDGLAGLPRGFAVKAEHRGSQMPVIGKLFSGGQAQVDTGDVRFDQEFVVVGHDPDEVRAFLTEERRRALQSLAESCPRFRLKGAEVTYRFDGSTEMIDDLARPAHAMLDAARVLTAGGVDAAWSATPVGGPATPQGEVFPGLGDAPAGPTAAQAMEPVAPTSDRGDAAATPTGVVFPAPDGEGEEPDVDASAADQRPGSG